MRSRLTAVVLDFEPLHFLPLFEREYDAQTDDGRGDQAGQQDLLDEGEDGGVASGGGRRGGGSRTAQRTVIQTRNREHAAND